MEIIIGRESGSQTPRLCLKIGNVSKYYGEAGSVPKSVSRNHCKLIIGENDQLTIFNVSDQNALYINGIEYQSEVISPRDLIELGNDRYRLDLSSILPIIDSIARQLGIPRTYNISSLKSVWNNYTQAKLDIQIRERKFNALSAIPGVISMISIALSFIDGLRVFFISIAAVFALTFALIRMKSAGKVPLQQVKLDEQFQDEYVCPHCKHFLGNQRYELVLRNGSCPWCKSSFTE